MGLAIDPAFADQPLHLHVLRVDARRAERRRPARALDGGRELHGADQPHGHRDRGPGEHHGELGRHSGCRPRFDSQGRLWVGTGDAASGSVPQSPTSLGGKVLRINRDGTGVAGNPAGALDPRIYSYGHRNVQGIAFRPSDGFGVDDRARPRPRRRAERPRARQLRLEPGSAERHRPTTRARPDDGPRRSSRTPSGALWSTGPRTFALSGAIFITGSQWGQWNGALAIALLKDAQASSPGARLDRPPDGRRAGDQRPRTAAQPRAGP